MDYVYYALIRQLCGMNNNDGKDFDNDDDCNRMVIV